MITGTNFSYGHSTQLFLKKDQLKVATTRHPIGHYFPITACPVMIYLLKHTCDTLRGLCGILKSYTTFIQTGSLALHYIRDLHGHVLHMRLLYVLLVFVCAVGCELHLCPVWHGMDKEGGRWTVSNYLHNYTTLISKHWNIKCS